MHVRSLTLGECTGPADYCFPVQRIPSQRHCQLTFDGVHEPPHGRSYHDFLPELAIGALEIFLILLALNKDGMCVERDLYAICQSISNEHALAAAFFEGGRKRYVSSHATKNSVPKMVRPGLRFKNSIQF